MKLGLFWGNGDSIQGSPGAFCELVFDSNKLPSPRNATPQKPENPEPVKP